MQLKAIKKVMQEYWENLPSNERREILSVVVSEYKLPKEHPVFHNDDIPYRCVRAWLEEIIAKKDFDFDYSQEICCFAS